MRIGLCDSGLGGIAVLKELKKIKPYNDYIYIGDTLNLPYGNKNKEELKILGQNMVDFLNTKNVDLIVIACGTLSSNVLQDLKSKTPIIDIITPTINYVKKNNIKELTVLATEATINSHIFKKSIPTIAEISCPKLVPMIESNQINKDFINELVNQTKGQVILGCTHYALIENLIDRQTINMGKVLANEIKENKGLSTIEIYCTKIDETIKNNIKEIINEEVKYARITRS